MKKFISVLLSVVLIISICPTGIFEFTASAATSGSCGTKVTWTYNTSTYTLTISGTGAMSDYTYYFGEYVTTAPWQSYYNTMKTVVINSGVTSIGSKAFYGCVGLSSITIPDSVTSIGDSAFSYCTGLKTAGPIGGGYDYEFGWTDKIPDYAFSGCKGLTSITIPDSVTSIGNSAFYGCVGLSSITIPDSVTTICSSAFYGCTGLTSITIPDSVTSIGSGAFLCCTELTSIMLPFTGTSRTATGPHGVFGVIFGYTTFSAGKKPSNSETADYIYSVYDENNKEIASKKYNDFHRQIRYKSLSEQNSYSDAFTPYRVGSNTVPTQWYSCYSERFNTIYPGHLGFYDSGGYNLVTYSYNIPPKLATVTITDSRQINDAAFANCKSINKIVLSNSTQSIGKRSFQQCTELKTITMSNSIDSISNSAFRGCTGLELVDYRGTFQQWDSISIGSDNTRLTSVNIMYCTCDEWFVITSATCAEPGVEYGTCTTCGNEIKRSTEPIGHNYVNTVDDKYLKTAADCTHGRIYYKSCSRCGKKSSETFESGEPLGHNYLPTVTPPTCTTQGYTTHTCSRCNDSYVADYVYMPCGENCGFIIKGNTLYIHGSGETDNYKTQTFVPWYEHANQTTETQIDEGITKIGNYAFYCLENLNSIKSKNKNLAFGKYTINDSNSDITVFSENGGSLETYCTENNINYIDPTITPELETVTANSITVKAVEGYEYSIDGTVWQKGNIFTGLSPAKEYNIYARYADTADIFDAAGTSLVVTTLKSTVATPAAPDYKAHTDSSVTLMPNNLYEFSIDGINWQKSNVFTGLSKNTIYRFYQRVAETETEYVSEPSAPLITAIPDKPVILEAGYDSILVKLVDGFEYCLDDFAWQDSSAFDMLIDNIEYYVYQRLKVIDGEKTYQITSDYTAVITDNAIVHTCIPGDWITDIEPTAQTDGARHKECTACGKVVETEVIPNTHIPGDINGDGIVNNKDLLRLLKHLSGWNVTINQKALDINNDGNVNNKDLIRLLKYLSGWDVELF